VFNNSIPHAGGQEAFMLTLVCIAIAMMLLAIGGVFVLMAKYNKRRGQSGLSNAASRVKQGRASGLD
jgi:hypothetical protein